MSELHLQDKFLVPFIKTELGYREAKPNTVTNSLIIEEDLQEFISTTTLNESLTLCSTKFGLLKKSAQPHWIAVEFHPSLQCIITV